MDLLIKFEKEILRFLWPWLKVSHSLLPGQFKC